MTPPASDRARSRILSLAVVVGLLFSVYATPSIMTAESASQFVFGAAGDYGYSSETQATWSSMGSHGLDLVIPLGDFAYGDATPSQWCSDFISHVNNVELITGNHDDGDIGSFAQACPFTLGQFTGTYAKQYYFDYPQSSPVARFVNIAPDIFGSYSRGDQNYTFTSNAIDGARSAGIPWVIVTMHKNCISTGSKSCEIGSDVFDLLLTKKVDLVLQGHDHNYQRSKQLATVAGCPSITPDSFNSRCVVGLGPGYQKGAGLVLVIQGTGGKGTYSVSSSDSEAGYFSQFTSCCHGFVKYTVSVTSLTAQFIDNNAGGFADSFSIGGISPPSLTGDFAFSPSSPEGGQLVTFTASQTGGVPPYSYSWNFGDGSPEVSGNPTTHTYTNAGGSFTVDLTVTDANGLTASVSHTAVVAPRLAVSVTGTPNPSEVGVSVSFSATTSGGVGGMTFSWDFGDGSSAGSGNPATHTYTIPGIRIVTVTVTDGIGVTATGTVSVPVNARLAVAPTASPSPVAFGQAVSFEAGITGGVSPVSCSWAFGDSTVTSGCNVTHVYATVGTFTATVTVNDALGMTDYGDVSVSVVNVCSVDFTWSPISPEGGQVVTFSATTASCDAPVSFVWKFGEGSTDSGNTAAKIYPDAGGAFTVTVTATDRRGATAAMSHTVIVASRLSHADFALTPAAPETGVSLTFTATQTGGVAPYMYTWDFGDTATGTGNPATHTYATAGTFNVTLEIRDSNAHSLSRSLLVSVISSSNFPNPNSPSPHGSPAPTLFDDFVGQWVLVVIVIVGILLLAGITGLFFRLGFKVKQGEAHAISRSAAYSLTRPLRHRGFSTKK